MLYKCFETTSKSKSLQVYVPCHTKETHVTFNLVAVILALYTLSILPKKVYKDILSLNYFRNI